MDEDRYIQIEGTVASLVYQNPENGYAVLRLETEGLVTAVGCMPGLSPGESLLLPGAWTTHQAYGEQFKAAFAERRMPTGSDAIYTYLASGVIKNVGPAKARDIVDKFGDRALEVIENEPGRLSEVPRDHIEKRAADERSLPASGRPAAGHRFSLGIRPEPLVAVRLYKCHGTRRSRLGTTPTSRRTERFGADFFEADAMALGARL
jgi:exodeoxyribonuclease V alpha subunit